MEHPVDSPIKRWIYFFKSYLFLVQTNTILINLGNDQHTRVEKAIQDRIRGLELIYNALKANYDIWIDRLKDHRERYSLIKLFSNREIMILIILLRIPKTPNSLRNRFLKTSFEFKSLHNQSEDEEQLTIHYLQHYLRSLRISQINLTTERLVQLYQKHRIEVDATIDICLKTLAQFLHDVFKNYEDILQQRHAKNEGQQFLVNLDRFTSTSNQNSLTNDFDSNTCCILLNIFQNQLPSAYQILWCSNATEEDILLFFSRIRSFPSLIFAVMDIDKMHHRLRELILNQQYLLTCEQDIHGQVFYFSRELKTGRRGLREFQVPDLYKDPNFSHQHLMKLFTENNIRPSKIQIIYGNAGVGK